MNSVIRQLREGYHSFGSIHYLKHLSFSSQALLLVNVNAQTINDIFDSALLNELSRVVTLLKPFPTVLVVIVHFVESFCLVYLENSGAVNCGIWLLCMSGCNRVLFLILRSEADNLMVCNVNFHSCLNYYQIAEIPK